MLFTIMAWQEDEAVGLTGVGWRGEKVQRSLWSPVCLDVPLLILQSTSEKQ